MKIIDDYNSPLTAQTPSSLHSMILIYKHIFYFINLLKNKQKIFCLVELYMTYLIEGRTNQAHQIAVNN